MSQVSIENSSTSTRWWLLAGAATLTTLATGYLAYGYSTDWKGPAYEFWCPKRRQLTLRSPFQGKLDQASHKLEIEARGWMERYVRTKLKGGQKT